MLEKIKLLISKANNLEAIINKDGLIFPQNVWGGGASWRTS
jgi:hypothetical protein